MRGGTKPRDYLKVKKARDQGRWLRVIIERQSEVIGSQQTGIALKGLRCGVIKGHFTCAVPRLFSKAFPC